MKDFKFHHLASLLLLVAIALNAWTLYELRIFHGDRGATHEAPLERKAFSELIDIVRAVAVANCDLNDAIFLKSGVAPKEYVQDGMIVFEGSRVQLKHPSPNRFAITLYDVPKPKCMELVRELRDDWNGLHVNLILARPYGSKLWMRGTTDTTVDIVAKLLCKQDANIVEFDQLY